jgi:hypothetical protein
MMWLNIQEHGSIDMHCNSARWEIYGKFEKSKPKSSGLLLVDVAILVRLVGLAAALAKATSVAARTAISSRGAEPLTVSAPAVVRVVGVIRSGLLTQAGHANGGGVPVRLM